MPAKKGHYQAVKSLLRKHEKNVIVALIPFYLITGEAEQFIIYSLAELISFVNVCSNYFPISFLAHYFLFDLIRSSLVAQMVKRLPIMWETRVQLRGREDPLEKEMATHSSTLAWKIPWTEEPGRLQPMGLQRVGHD